MKKGYQKDYRIITINGSGLLQKNEIKTKNSNNYLEFNVDFRKDILGGKVDSNLIIEELNEEKHEYNENALTYQIKQVLLNRGIDEKKIRNEMSKSLVYVDFSFLFKNGKFPIHEGEISTLSEKQVKNADNSLKLKFLFDSKDKGFNIIYKDDEIRHYVPFDKSNSMSKECKISFIDKSIVDEVNKRLLLDLPLTNVSLNLSKFFSWRGLYMTEAKRLSQNEVFELNEETVIVLKDETHTALLGQTIFTNDENYENENPEFHIVEVQKEYYSTKESKDKKEKEEEVFDGEGLVSPYYMKEINKQLLMNNGGLGHATSIQVRLPFSKGVLHQVDFNKFLRDEINLSSLKIKDYFGIERDLSKAHIIMTHGMFKIAKILGHLDLGEDPMKYYFDKIKEYQHAMYVCNTFENINNGKYTVMNYQFLNTLNLSKDEFQKLIEKSEKNSKEILEDKYIKNKEYSENISENGDVYLQALSRNKAFLNISRIKTYIKNDIRSKISDIYNGHLYVEGEQRVLSRDLLALLVSIVRQSSNQKYISKDSEQAKKMEEIRAQYCLHPTKFYIPPLDEGIHPKHDETCAFFRSPHLSRNEQCILTARVPNKKFALIDKYFGHLTSIVMIGRDSIAPEILGGADFDGDEIKIVKEQTIVNAIKNSVYKKDIKLKYKDSLNRYDLEDEYYIYTKRRMPVAKITPFKNGKIDENYKNSIPYKTVVNTFANKIGIISNLAIQLSRKAYKGDVNTNENKCAECTIVTGLEIDAGKTGLHPTKYIEKLSAEAGINEQKSKKNKEKDSIKDYYINTNKQIDALLKQSREGYPKDIVAEPVGNNDEKYYKLYWKTKEKQSKDVIEIKQLTELDSDPTKMNIDYLLVHYAQALEKNSNEEIENQYKELINRVQNMPKFKFDFEQDENWKKNLDLEKKEKTAAILKAYNAAKTKIKVTQYQDSVKDKAWKEADNNICKILEEQNHLYKVSEINGTDVYNEMRLKYSNLKYNLDEYFELNEEITVLDAYKNVFDMRWSYTPDSEKEEKLYKIIGVQAKDYLTEEDKNLLFNFDKGGNKILLYLLNGLRIEEAYKPTDEDDEKSEENNISEPSKIDKKMFEDFYNVYKNYNVDTCDNTLKYELLAELQRKLSVLFEFDYDEELKYVYATKENLISDILDNETIVNHVYMEEE